MRDELYGYCDITGWGSLDVFTGSSHSKAPCMSMEVECSAVRA
jgi:hypothetical protein